MVLIENNNKWVENITKEDKKVKKVLHRLLDEENSKIKKSLELVSILNYQAESFSKMFPQKQDNVMQDMFSLMRANGWDEWCDRLKKELNKDLNSEESEQ